MKAAMDLRGAEELLGADTRQLAQSLIARIEKSHEYPCFILAPRCCGQAELLSSYLSQSSGEFQVVEIEVLSDGSCTPSRQPSGLSQTLQRQQNGLHLETSRAVLPAQTGASAERIALLTFVPWLEDQAAVRLSEEIDSLLHQGFYVVALCPAQNDRYGNLQADRLEIAAFELMASGFLKPQRYGDCLRQFLAEFLPLQIRLGAVLATIFGQSTIEDISQLGYRLAPDMPQLLEELHPFFHAGVLGGEIVAEPVALHYLEQAIPEVISEYLLEQGQPVSNTILASRITMISMLLLERGRLEASHQILELAEVFMQHDLDRTDDAPDPFANTWLCLLNAYQASQAKTGFSEDRAALLPAAQTASQASVQPAPNYRMQTATNPRVVPLSLRLFGNLEVRIEGRPVKNKQLARSKIRRLLAYLALNQQRLVQRDSLFEYLWPFLDFEKAQNNLYTSWGLLSKAFGYQRARECPYLERHGEVYQLNQEFVTIDTEQFETLARNILLSHSDADCQMQNLLELEVLYRDVLVADIPTDSFLNARMVGYRSLMVDILLFVARQQRLAGEIDKALFCARAAYDLDESREDVYWDLMNTQYEAGQRTTAMQTYFSCKQYLANELGILPSKRTTALYQELLLDNCR